MNQMHVGRKTLCELLQSRGGCVCGVSSRSRSLDFARVVENKTLRRHDSRLKVLLVQILANPVEKPSDNLKKMSVEIAGYCGKE